MTDCVYGLNLVLKHKRIGRILQLLKQLLNFCQVIGQMTVKLMRTLWPHSTCIFLWVWTSGRVLRMGIHCLLLFCLSLIKCVILEVATRPYIMLQTCGIGINVKILVQNLNCCLLLKSSKTLHGTVV